MQNISLEIDDIFVVIFPKKTGFDISFRYSPKEMSNLFLGK